MHLYIGTYTPPAGRSRGIYRLDFDPASGRLGNVVLAAETPNPTFLALDPEGKFLFSVTQSGTVGGKPGGAIASYRIDTAAGHLVPVGVQPTGGASLAHVSMDATGRMLAAASYGGAEVCAFFVGRDGRLGARTASIRMEGPTGPNAVRQDQPHPHSVTFSPDNRFAYVCDLGLDRVYCYRIDPALATLVPAGEFASEAGAGPRHCRITSDGRFCYVINELSGTMSAFARAPKTGALERVQSASTLPEDFKGENTCAEVRLARDERFVYGSNRGHDSIAVFLRNRVKGTLKRIQIIPTGGAHPRNFALSPDGNWLVCANRDSDSLTVFRVNRSTGKLEASEHSATVPQAVCVQFAGSASRP